MIVFILSLVATRSVTVGFRRIGVVVKAGALAVIFALLAAHAASTPVALAGGLAIVLMALVVAEQLLFPPERAG